MIQLYREKDTLIKNFTIYGERHSGTNFLEDTIKSCFDLPVTWDFGWKHFFGFARSDKLYLAKNTLFIGIVRDPYEWLMAMSLRPHHVPRQNSSSIYSFLQNEWYSIDFSGNEIGTDKNYKTLQRYKNVFDLRKHKLLYLYDIMPTLVSNYILITYDKLIQNPQFYLNIIHTKYNINIYNDSINIEKKYSYEISKDVLQIINTNIDWIEELKFNFIMR